MPDYGKPEYWDERYKANDTTFDWYVSFEALKEIMLPLSKPESKILMIGCGNSRLSSQLYEAGYQNITNLDISEVCINQMKQRYKDMDKMEWIRMDATKLDFPDASFDLVIDKGTTDAILCGSNSFHNVHQMNKHISRVMKKGTYYICISYGQPDTRIDHFRRKKLNWEVEHKTVDKPVFSSDSAPSSNYHVYVMMKGDEAPEEDDDDDDDDEEDDDFYDKFQAATMG
jgi:cyclopropane fatty-acyl-phospholipid synthase-like methyltransferase